ncbi:MAG: RNA-binding cell elongation regulator Jag/EloR [Candidatus Limnocylindrales bacterium]
MSEYQEFTGKTVEEALRNARESFAVGGLDDLDFEILTPGSRGVLGMGAEPARIVAAPRAALGGAAPRREAAATVPLPAPPPRPERDRVGFQDRDRGDRGDRGGRAERGGFRARDRGDRGGERGDRGRGRSAEAPSRPLREEAAAGAEATPGPAGDTRAATGGEGRPPTEASPSADAPGQGRTTPATALSSAEEMEVTAAARAPLAVEREEVQAAEASPEVLAAGQEILQTLMQHMGFAVTVEVQTGDTSKLDVRAGEAERDALGALIGRKGERLSALQHLVNLMLSRRMGTWTRVLVDVEDYRGRRERQLRDLARRAADRVQETGKMLQLEPMPALERRWVHLSLRDIEGVATQSIGEEPNRRVVVLPREG